jgi:hypothetical protein
MREQFGEKITLTGSKPTKVEVRGVSVGAGAFYPVTVFFAKDGIKRVTGGFKSADTFDNQLYAAKQSENGAITFTTTGSVPGVKNNQELISQDMTTGSLKVYFQNKDTVAHTIDADAIGWAN